MKRLLIRRPSRTLSAYGYSAEHKRRYKANKTTLRFPWANESFTFYPEYPNKKDSKGRLENYWDQGCQHASLTYLEPDNLEVLQNDLNTYNNKLKKIARLECEYNAWLTGRYRVDSEVKSNCDQVEFVINNLAPSRLRCVNTMDEVLSKGASLDQNWKNYYLAAGKLDSLDVRIAELEQDIAYEKKQAQNLKTERERRGIDQRDIDILYPEAQAVMNELAPQASPALEAADEQGEFTDEDGDGRNDNTGMTNEEKRYWLYAGIGVFVFGLSAFIATKKIK